MEPLLTEQLISVLFAFSMGQDIVDMESLVFSVVLGFGFFWQLMILFILISCPVSHLEPDLVSPKAKGLSLGR